MPAFARFGTASALRATCAGGWSSAPASAWSAQVGNDGPRPALERLLLASSRSLYGRVPALLQPATGGRDGAGRPVAGLHVPGPNHNYETAPHRIGGVRAIGAPTGLLAFRLVMRCRSRSGQPSPAGTRR